MPLNQADSTMVKTPLSGVLGGSNNIINHPGSFVIGSNITTSASNTLFVNNISASGIIYGATGGGGAVTSVAGRTGAVTLGISDVSLLQTGLDSKLNASGGIVSGNLTINGNLTATGTTTFTGSTVYTSTSALSVVNFGSGAALYVGQSGLGDIASFYDLDRGVEVLHVGGADGTFPNVGIKTSTPNKTLTVNGEISASGKIWGDGTGLTLPAPTGGALGGVKAGTNIAIAGDGTISSAPPVATTSVLGGVKQGTNITIAADGTISGSAPFTLLAATASVLGGVKQGTNITIAGDGTISSTPPIATASVLGGVKQGTNITIDAGGVISSPVAAGHTHAWNDITSKPSFHAVATSGNYADLSNKPPLGTAAALDVPAVGNASSTQVVKGDDSRLSDARTPVSHTHAYSTITNTPSLGTSSALNVPATGNALTGEVVKGNDTRLSDARTPISHTHAISDVTGLTAALTPLVSTKTADYTLTSSDANSVIVFNANSASYLSVPSDSVSIPIGSQVTVIQEGFGNVIIQIVAASGVSLQSYGARYTTTGRYAVASLVKTAANTWRLGGTLS